MLVSLILIVQKLIIVQEFLFLPFVAITPPNTYASGKWLPCEQRFPSCMAFNSNNIIKSRSCGLSVNQLCNRQATRITSETLTIIIMTIFNEDTYFTLKCFTEAMQDRNLCLQGRKWRWTEAMNHWNIQVGKHYFTHWPLHISPPSSLEKKIEFLWKGFTARSPKVWPPLINSHSFMHTLTNQKSRTVSNWLLIGLNLHERMWINQKRSHFWAPCCNCHCHCHLNKVENTNFFSFSFKISPSVQEYRIQA